MTDKPLFEPMRPEIAAFARGASEGAAEKLVELMRKVPEIGGNGSETLSVAAQVIAAQVVALVRLTFAMFGESIPPPFRQAIGVEFCADAILLDVDARVRALMEAVEEVEAERDAAGRPN